MQSRAPLLKVSEEGPLCILSVKGRLGFAERSQAIAEVDERVEARARRLVFDLSETTMLSSDGIEVFLHARKRIEKAGGEVSIVCPKKELRELFELTKLSKVFKIYSSLDEVPR